MKKCVVAVVVVAVVCSGLGVLVGHLCSRGGELTSLPAPEVSEGQRGELGIDKNINENNIDQYLGRSDSVYLDMRMIEDPAEYEAINGDRFLSGYVRGFEVVPYPYLAPVVGLPEAVGAGYVGPSLFSLNETGDYVANYTESEQIVADLFPKDKKIFLMCGGGGYAGMTKKMLVKMGWDASKIYVVGGYWNYEGENDVKVKQDDGSYAYWKIPYHEIKFEELTRR